MFFENTVEPETLELLRALLALAELQDFALVGGTALALQLGHRKSIDLHFFTQTDFAATKLIDAVSSNLDTVVTGQDPFSLNCEISGVKVDLLRHRHPLISDLVTQDGITLWSIEEIAAAKILAITNRGAKKDFYDLVEIMRTIPLETIFNLFEKKYSFADRFIALKSLSWFEDADEEPDPISLRELSWPDVKNSVISALKRRSL